MNQPTVGIAIIAKNESAMIARCLTSVKDADEIVVVDTGSTDNTMEIARQFTPRVYDDFKWCDDFAAARNWVREKMTTDFILSIDCDEVLHDFSKVREVIAQTSALAVNCKLFAEDNGQLHLFPRLFRNSPQVRWVAAVHNHLNVVGEDIGDVRITYGYSPAHFQDPDRSLRILEKETAKPDGVRARFYLGRELRYRGRNEEAVLMLGKYVQESRYLAERADAFLIMSRCYWSLGMGDDARDACAQAILCNANFREAILFMAEISGDGRGNPAWQKNADQWKRLAETATNEDVLFVRQ